MKCFLSLICLILCGCSSNYKVIGIVDGDTIDVLSPKNVKIRVRLAHIDAPEKNQDFGSVAKKAIGEKVFGKPVKLDGVSKDRYGRVLAVVICRGDNINLEMIQEGLAWHYKQFSKSPIYAKAQNEARKQHKGIWSQPNPIPPWEYRRPRKSEKNEQRPKKGKVQNAQKGH